MGNSIPTLSILAMAVSALIGIAIPAVLYVIYRKKGAKHLSFWTGAVTFVLFAFVLEQLAYFFLMKTALWTTITGNIMLYGVVGGFLAGLFEETGRFVAFKTVLRKKRGNDYNGLMYGASHGGEKVSFSLGHAVRAKQVGPAGPVLPGPPGPVVEKGRQQRVHLVEIAHGVLVEDDDVCALSLEPPAYPPRSRVL
ncbi:MAG: YhfC family intramembrane metalloprotease [Alphaproteobacteria bacterium]|nr:YhfC family intramembrane metalloprotease [Alphaproteobacteria bacterium]